MLAVATDILLAGRAASPAEAIMLTQRLRPDVIIINCNSPGDGGIETAYRIRKGNPETGVLLITRDITRDDIIGGLKAGVGAFIEAKTVTDRLVPAIRALHHTGCYLPPACATTFMLEYMKVLSPADHHADVLAGETP